MLVLGDAGVEGDAGVPGGTPVTIGAVFQQVPGAGQPWVRTEKLGHPIDVALLDGTQEVGCYLLVRIELGSAAFAHLVQLGFAVG